MRHLLKKLLPSAAVILTVTSSSLPMPARAQTYPIDCAILLCLSGGWPASVPCARARAEFIRRITPWPIEPPLQIWRCPMAISLKSTQSPDIKERITQLYFRADVQRSGMGRQNANEVGKRAISRPHMPTKDRQTSLPTMVGDTHLTQERADIDISGPEFDFVRSIRVFDIRSARQWRSLRTGNCRRLATVYLGTYGSQGDFNWTLSSVADLPNAHSGLETWGANCPRISHRSVFIDWHDFQGLYGFEQVNY